MPPRASRVTMFLPLRPKLAYKLTPDHRRLETQAQDALLNTRPDPSIPLRKPFYERS